MGKRSRTGTIGTFRIFAGRRFAWMGLWTAWISTAIGFYYAVVSGWTLKYFQLGITGALNGEDVDTTEVWNAFLQSPGQVIFFQFVVILLVLGTIWKGAKAIEKVNFYLMISLFALLFLTLFLALTLTTIILTHTESPSGNCALRCWETPRPKTSSSCCR